MDAAPIPSGQALPAGTRIEEFVIERVLGSGGFGITCLARDTSLKDPGPLAVGNAMAAARLAKTAR